MAGKQPTVADLMFQSPRSGQICSNLLNEATKARVETAFQSPRSGQICSNLTPLSTEVSVLLVACFNPLDRVKFVQIKIVKNFEKAYAEAFQSPRSGQICSNNYNGSSYLLDLFWVSIP